MTDRQPSAPYERLAPILPDAVLLRPPMHFSSGVDSTSAASAAKPCGPLRKSTGRIASHDAHHRTGKADLDHRRREGLADPLRVRLTGRCVRDSRRRLRHDRHEAGRSGWASRFHGQRQRPLAGLPPRQPQSCCGQTCQRRATSVTVAPACSVSATIRPFSSAFERAPFDGSPRRRPPPDRPGPSQTHRCRHPLQRMAFGRQRCEGYAQNPRSQADRPC